MKTTISTIAGFAAVGCLSTAFGVTILESGPVTLDLQTGIRIPSATETATFGPNWTGGGPVSVLLDGVLLDDAENLSEEGSLDWTVAGAGFHTLAMSDALGRTNTVTFFVPASTGTSDGSPLDLQSGVRRAAETETIEFGPNWTGGGPVTVSVNGTALASDQAEEGSLVWTPVTPGLYELALGDALGRTNKVLFAVGGSEASGEGSLDLLPGVRISAREQPLAYSSAWIGVPSATVSVTEDGTPVLEGMTGEGVTEWLPTTSGLYELAHVTQTEGVTTESLSALFLVLADTFGPSLSYTNGEIIVTETGKATLTTTVPNGVIRYTLDGSDPTSSSTEYTKPVRITNACTIKAQVFVNGVAYGYVTEATVAFGQTADPVIVSEGGVTFHFSDNHIILSCATADSTIHYTLDGTDPDVASAVYGAPIQVASDTTVKAYATRTNYFDSKIVSLDIVREWLKLSPPTFTPTSFSGGSVLVTISNEVEGTTIRYARDGADLETDGTEYAEPVQVLGGTVFVAQATKYDYLDSDVVTQAIERVWQPGDAIGTPGWTIVQDGDHPWVLDEETTHDGISSMRSGAIGHNQTSTMTATVSGAGTLAFWWKADCEGDDADDYDDWDRIELLVDGVKRASIDYRTDWVPVSVELGTGDHTIVWQYVKDDANSLYGDCGWVDDVVWAPAAENEWTTTTPEPVPYSWLRQYGLLPEGADPEEVAWMPNGKSDADGTAQQVWSEYVTGTDPTVKESRFLAYINMDADGNPVVTPLPDLGELRTYKVIGKNELTDEAWAEPATAENQFFRVKVSVSEKSAPAYCVIDLSEGAEAQSYPVSYLSEPPEGGFNTDEFKTDKLVLKRISAGSFIMGKDQTVEAHRVTLTNAFYAGLFEVTQKQWELVMGTRPSFFTNENCYAARPVERVSYDMIRGSTGGSEWPGSSLVDADSFLGRLRGRTGIDTFDLPTEAQWEYACRAGTTTHFGNGTDYSVDSGAPDPAMDAVGRNGWNSGYFDPDVSYEKSSPLSIGTAKAGSYEPNLWGLYDMHGNVCEWCLNWLGTRTYGVAPEGPSSGTERLQCGGCWNTGAANSTSSSRSSSVSTDRDSIVGFRLFRTIP